MHFGRGWNHTGTFASHIGRTSRYIEGRMLVEGFVVSEFRKYSGQHFGQGLVEWFFGQAYRRVYMGFMSGFVDVWEGLYKG